MAIADVLTDRQPGDVDDPAIEYERGPAVDVGEFHDV